MKGKKENLSVSLLVILTVFNDCVNINCTNPVFLAFIANIFIGFFFESKYQKYYRNKF